jgi:hypothetical protein
VLAVRGAGGGPELPHDLVHALVEDELGIRDGIWGCVADGAVWCTMRHVSGRRPPHAGDRSGRVKRERTAAIGRAEALADLVHRMAEGAELLPGEIAGSGVPPERLEAAAAALRAAGRRWAAMSPGEQWLQDWPARPARVAARRGRS